MANITAEILEARVEAINAELQIIANNINEMLRNIEEFKVLAHQLTGEAKGLLQLIKLEKYEELN